MLQDIADIRYFKIRVNQAKQVTDFFYRHGRLLNAMREKTGGRSTEADSNKICHFISDFAEFVQA